MNPSTKYFVFAALFIGFFAWVMNNQKESDQINLEVGKYYQHSFNWTPEDPFEVTIIDTIKIVDIKDGYVQWEYKNGFRLSSKIQYLAIDIKKEIQ